MSDAGATAQRLETVRQDAGYADLRSFWRHLTSSFQGDDGFHISYDAARTYHDLQRDPPREPPAAYLARVARVFGVSLEWLATGDGPMRAPSRMPAAQEALLRAAPETAGMGAGVRAALGELAERSMLPFYGFDHTTGGPADEPYAGLFEELAGDWWGQVQAPLVWIMERLGRPVRPDARQSVAYATAMLHALSLALDMVPARVLPDGKEADDDEA